MVGVLWLLVVDTDFGVGIDGTRSEVIALKIATIRLVGPTRYHHVSLPGWWTFIINKGPPFISFTAIPLSPFPSLRRWWECGDIW